MIRWKDEYLIGVEKIDKQHQELFNITNRAYDLLDDEFVTDKYDKIINIIEELKQYTIFHFKEEEEYMLSIKYKRYFSQKVEHDEFVKKINDVNLRDIDVDQKKYLTDLLEFVIDWISSHILGSDKKITQKELSVK
jgi:hemerythrin